MPFPLNAKNEFKKFQTNVGPSESSGFLATKSHHGRFQSPSAATLGMNVVGRRVGLRSSQIGLPARCPGLVSLRSNSC
jgi:hypothetical protein